MPAMLPVARTTGVRIEDLGDELIVRGSDRDLDARLNRTAAVVWRNCDGRHSIADLVKVLRSEVGEVANEDLVMTALDRLEDLGLIESGYPRREVAAVRISRRRFIGHVGAASAAALALPVVQSLIAPTATAKPKPGKYYGPGRYYHTYYGVGPGYYQNYYGNYYQQPPPYYYF